MAELAKFEDNWVTEAMADETIVANFLLNFAKPNRDYPITPLLWGAAATSGGDDCKESSRPTNLVDTSRYKKVGDPNETATAEKKKKRKLALVSLPTFEIDTTPLVSGLAAFEQIASTPPVSGETVLDPHQIVEAQSDPSVQDKVLHEESPVCTANASPEQQEMNNQELIFLLPDLNLPAEEEEVKIDVVPPELSE